MISNSWSICMLNCLCLLQFSNILCFALDRSERSVLSIYRIMHTERERSPCGYIWGIGRSHHDQRAKLMDHTWRLWIISRINSTNMWTCRLHVLLYINCVYMVLHWNLPGLIRIARKTQTWQTNNVATEQLHTECTFILIGCFSINYRIAVNWVRVTAYGLIFAHSFRLRSNRPFKYMIKHLTHITPHFGGAVVSS